MKFFFRRDQSSTGEDNAQTKWRSIAGKPCSHRSGSVQASRLARDDSVSDGQCMLVLDVVVTRSAFMWRRLQETQQCVTAVTAGGFVFHVEEVAGRLKRGEGAVLNVIGEQSRAIGGGVFVPFAVQEQHGDVDFFRCFEEALAVAVQQVVDVKVHLPVFMIGQAADVAIVEALEQ